jgi:enoyl-CoA hydratase/carnithine racemase
MARSHGLSDARIADVAPEDAATAIALRVAEALCPSPVAATKQLVKEVRASGLLSAAMLVELVSAIATLQLVHRTLAFYEAPE